MSTYRQEAVDTTMSFKLSEQHVYGSSRLGMATPEKEMLGADTTAEFGFDTLNKRQYELANHLGNVLTVIYDRKVALDTNSDSHIDYYLADLASSSDYSPFGAPLANRGFKLQNYRYGFNGQEKDDEISGDGNSNTADFWQYDTRLGRRWNIDPVTKPWESSYATFANSPVYYNDISGLDKEKADEADKKQKETVQGQVENGDTYTDSQGSTFRYDKDLGGWFRQTVALATNPNVQNNTTEASLIAPGLPAYGVAIEATIGIAGGLIIGGAIALPLATGATLEMPEHEKGDWIVYKINYVETDLNTGMPVSSGVYKYGISGQPGYSEKPGHPRPGLQTNALNATERLLVNEGVVNTQFTYTYDIIIGGISKLSAEFVEQEMVNQSYITHGAPPDGNKRPIPDALRGRERSKFQKLDNNTVNKIKDFINNL